MPSHFDSISFFSFFSCCDENITREMFTFIRPNSLGGRARRLGSTSLATASAYILAERTCFAYAFFTG